MRPRRWAAKGKRLVVPGDLVLIGSAGVSMPSDWWIDEVLWVDGEDILVEHHAPSGGTYRQVMHISQVRAVGDRRAMCDFKDRCRAAVKKQQERVRKCEQALGAARDAVWAKLDQIAASDPPVFKPEKPE